MLIRPGPPALRPSSNSTPSQRQPAATAVRVAAGAVARKWLKEQFGVVIRGYLSRLGPIEVPFGTWDAVDANPFFVADAAYVPRLERFMAAPPRVSNARRANRPWVSLSARAGQLILFESWLRHEVTPSQVAAERVSISFNYSWF